MVQFSSVSGFIGYYFLRSLYYKLARFKSPNYSGQRSLTSALPVRRTVSQVRGVVYSKFSQWSSPSVCESTPSRRGATELIIKLCPLAAEYAVLLAPLRSVQFNAVYSIKGNTKGHFPGSDETNMYFLSPRGALCMGWLRPVQGYLLTNSHCLAKG